MTAEDIEEASGHDPKQLLADPRRRSTDPLLTVEKAPQSRGLPTLGAGHVPVTIGGHHKNVQEPKLLHP